MPLHLPTNPYRGVNAHLHSYFQQEAGWADFHQSHITDLRRALQTELPVQSGYIVSAEESLQIGQYDIATQKETIIYTRPDVGIYRGIDDPSAPAAAAIASPPSLVFPTSETLIETENITGLVFYKVEGDDKRIITRLEVLSPGNKPPGSHFGHYLAKRDLTLKSKIKLVEVDYLHERRSPISPIPDYPKREAGAFPYSIAVSVLSNIEDFGETRVYAFRVDDPLPKVPIPLDKDDFVILDFGKVYQQTFQGNNLYTDLWVDYAELPLNPEAYDEEDQRRIKAVMARAAKAGHNEAQ